MLVKVTRGNQVTIPKEIVKKAHIREGNDYVDVQYSNGVIFMKPMDVEERLSDEICEKLLQKAFKKETGDVALNSKEAVTFLKKRIKK